MGGWQPEEASEWAAHGYAAREADFISTIVRRDLLAHGDFGPPRVLERQWMRSGLTPRWVCLCVAAGVQSPAEAEQLRERSRSEPSLEGELHLRGVVLRGADARSLTFVDPDGGLS